MSNFHRITKKESLTPTRRCSNILTEFFTVHAAQLTGNARLKVLEGITADLEAFSSVLPRSLRIFSDTEGISASPLATGVRELIPARHACGDEADWATSAGSFQLSQLGISVVLMRLTIESIDATARWQLAATLHAAFSVTSSIVDFLEGLAPAECSLFWMPCKGDNHNTARLSLNSLNFRLVLPHQQRRLADPPHHPPREVDRPGPAHLLRHPPLPSHDLTHDAPP